jgi:exosome complex RNA-binding protein Rrp4
MEDLHFVELFLPFWSCSGHGTYIDNEMVVASVAGTVERVNRLITVRAIHGR